MILALETATKVCSVAFTDESGNVFEKRIEQRGMHSEKLFLFIEELQNEHEFRMSELEAVLVSEGPGSYTGLRIGASAVKGLLFQIDVPLFGINTLASFAKQAIEKIDATTVHSIIDARRVHVYHQKFTTSNSQLETDDEVEVIPIEAFEAMVRKDDVIIGTGINRIDENVRSKTQTFGAEELTARSLISLFNDRSSSTDFIRQVDPELFEPRYYTSNQVD